MTNIDEAEMDRQAMSEIVMGHTLTLAERDAELVVRGCNSSGQGEPMKALAKLPLAIAELGKPKRLDHVFLTRYSDTDYCCWIGRNGSGYFQRIGRLMRIVTAGRAHA